MLAVLSDQLEVVSSEGNAEESNNVLPSTSKRTFRVRERDDVGRLTVPRDAEADDIPLAFPRPAPILHVVGDHSRGWEGTDLSREPLDFVDCLDIFAPHWYDLELASHHAGEAFHVLR